MSKKIFCTLCSLSCFHCGANELTLNHKIYNEALNAIRSEAFEGKSRSAAQLDANKTKSSLGGMLCLDVRKLELKGDVALWYALSERMRDSSSGNLVCAAQARMDIIALFRRLNAGIDDAALGMILKLHDDYILGKTAQRLELAIALLQGEHQQIIWPQSRELSIALLNSLYKTLKESH